MDDHERRLAGNLNRIAAEHGADDIRPIALFEITAQPQAPE